MDVVSQLPALADSINSAQTVEQIEIEGDADGGSSLGVATLNLRNLGTKRTLVLIDGRRHVGGRAGDTAVDINTIPITMIDRVEILTGGASAIYGADAVSGVVNFITKKYFEGFDFRVQGTTSGNGHRNGLQLSALMGGTFANKKGSAMVAIEYRHQSMLSCHDSPFCRGFGVSTPGRNPAAINNPDAAPLAFIPNQREASSSPLGRFGVDFDGDGLADTSAPSGFVFDVDNNGVVDVGQTPLGQEGFGDWVVDQGSIRLFEPGQLGGDDGDDGDDDDNAGFVNQVGGDGTPLSPYDFESLGPKRDSVVVNALMRYQLTDELQLYSDTKVALTQTEAVGGALATIEGLSLATDNPYIPEQLRSSLASVFAEDPALADTTSLIMNRSFIDLGQNRTHNERVTLRLVAGAVAKLGETIRVDASYNYGRTSEEIVFENRIIQDRLLAAIDVVTDQNGAPACRSSVIGSQASSRFLSFSPDDGTCHPLNLFGFGAPAPAAINFVTQDVAQTSVVDQQVANLSLTADSSEFDFSLPGGGAIAIAVGGEYRKESSRLQPDALGVNGLRIDDGTITTGLEGSYDVWELFGELSIPLVQHMPALEQLTLSTAARFAEYSTVGANLSWQLGGVWKPTADVLVRAGYSVAVRAPNIGELFQASTQNVFRRFDPCDQAVIAALSQGGSGDDDDAPVDPEVRRANCAADGVPEDYTQTSQRISGERAGNPNLREETAYTWTLGLLTTPRFIPGLRMMVDYFDIELNDTIDRPSLQDILNNCYDSPSGLDDRFCSQFSRNRNPDSPNFLAVENARVTQLNLSRTTVAGIDFDISYTLNLRQLSALDLGLINLRLFGTHLFWLDAYPNPDDPDFLNDELFEVRRPQLLMNASLQWLWSDLTIGYNLNMMSDQIVDVRIEDEELFDDAFAGETFVQDISVQYALNENFLVYGGINNLSNVSPFKTLTAFPVSPAGRLYFLGIRGQL